MFSVTGSSLKQTHTTSTSLVPWLNKNIYRRTVDLARICIQVEVAPAESKAPVVTQSLSRVGAERCGVQQKRPRDPRQQESDQRSKANAAMAEHDWAAPPRSCRSGSLMTPTSHGPSRPRRTVRSC